MNEEFRDLCIEYGIEYSEFPFDFPAGGIISYPAITRAMLWIMKRVMDKRMPQSSLPMESE